MHFARLHRAKRKIVMEVEEEKGKCRKQGSQKGMEKLGYSIYKLFTHEDALHDGIGLGSETETVKKKKLSQGI